MCGLLWRLVWWRWWRWTRLLIDAISNLTLQTNEAGKVHVLVCKSTVKPVALLGWLLHAPECNGRILRRRGCLVAVMLPVVARSIRRALCSIFTSELRAVRGRCRELWALWNILWRTPNLRVRAFNHGALLTFGERQNAILSFRLTL